MPSPKPEPTRLKLLKGNPGKRAINHQEPQPDPGIPETPAHLTGEALAEWNRITAEMNRCGMLTKCDRATVAEYCTAWATYVKAAAAFESEGMVTDGARGPVVNPTFRILDASIKQLSRLAPELGLSPSSRSRIHVGPSTKSQTLDDLIGE